jgi:glycosyltransferase involved in cell wall biosynthesis
MKREPFVSILTPVYNGEPFLAECIDSVLAQDYPNWEYIVVNNCSTDRTLKLAQQYARRDSRIRVVNNRDFLNCEENHNNALRQISPRSEYSKVVSADDRLVPHSLGKMVRFAMRHPTVGIVGSYQQAGDIIDWKGLPENVSVLSGRDACRVGLLQGIHIFGNPTSVLYRSDLTRRTASFFPHSEPHADTSAFYEHLRDCDFGFMHEVLSLKRVHEGQLSTRYIRLQAGSLAYIDDLVHYGPHYLTETEFSMRLHQVLAGYYRGLGRCALKMKGQDFWTFHESKLASLGYPLDRRRVLLEAIREFAGKVRNPIAAFRNLGLVLMKRSQS